MDVQPIRFVFERHKLAGLDDPMRFGEVLLCEALNISASTKQVLSQKRRRHTVSFAESLIFFPMSLLTHSSWPVPLVLVTPGTTRGILMVVCCLNVLEMNRGWLLIALIALMGDEGITRWMD